MLSSDLSLHSAANGQNMQDVAFGAEPVAIPLSLGENDEESAQLQLDLLRASFSYSNTMRLPEGLDDVDKDVACECRNNTCHLHEAQCECVQSFGNWLVHHF